MSGLDRILPSALLRATPTFFFVVGSPKSGTTWLAQMLAQHPQICCEFEGYFFGRESHIETLYNSIVLNERLRRWGSRSFNRWSRDIDSELLNIFRYTVTYFLTKSGLRVRLYGDKTPLMGLGEITTMHETFPEAKVIHIVRDGRDVMVSAAHHKAEAVEGFFANQEVQSFSEQMKVMESYVGLFSNDQVARVASNWSMHNCECYHTGKELFGDRYISIRYEDLLSSPYDVIKSLLMFLRVLKSRRVIEEILHTSRFSARTKGRQPGEEDKSSFFRKGISGDWTNYLNDCQNRLFQKCAAEAMGIFGYTSNP